MTPHDCTPNCFTYKFSVIFPTMPTEEWLEYNRQKSSYLVTRYDWARQNATEEGEHKFKLDHDWETPTLQLIGPRWRGRRAHLMYPGEDNVLCGMMWSEVQWVNYGNESPRRLCRFCLYALKRKGQSDLGKPKEEK